MMRSRLGILEENGVRVPFSGWNLPFESEAMPCVGEKKGKGEKKK